MFDPDAIHPRAVGIHQLRTCSVFYKIRGETCRHPHRKGPWHVEGSNPEPSCEPLYRRDTLHIHAAHILTMQVKK